MSNYDRDLVERLLPAVWDETYAYGMAAPHSPDPDMPKGTVDPKRGGTLFAHLADIRIAWERVTLTERERRAVFMRYCLDTEQDVIAAYEGVVKSVVSERLYIAIGKLVAQLNGGEFIEEYDEEVAA